MGIQAMTQSWTLSNLSTAWLDGSAEVIHRTLA